MIESRRFELRQTLLYHINGTYTTIGKRGDLISEDERNRIQFLYSNGRIHFNDEDRTRANRIATFDQLYRRA